MVTPRERAEGLVHEHDQPLASCDYYGLFQPNVRVPGTQGARLEGLLEEITRQLDEGKTGADLYLGLSSTDAARGSACRLVTIFSRWARSLRSLGAR